VALQIDIQNKLVAAAVWISILPENLIRERPWLCVYRAWGQQWMGQRELVSQNIKDAESALEKNERIT
jgi:hypothetical protein